MSKFIEIITTSPSKKISQKIAESILKKKLAACAQTVGPVQSSYWWNNKIETAKEWLCIIKTEKKMFKLIENEIKFLHPYELPQIIYTSPIKGSIKYMQWIHDVIK
jgi:periplasmic divalent cation tolerance protein